MQVTMKSMLFLVVLMFAAQAGATPAKSKWVSLDADSKNRLMKIVRSEVQSREGFSTLEEDRLNTSLVEQEKQRETSAYKAAISAANAEFVRTKKRRDDLMTQFQTASYDFEELKKRHDTIKASITNIDNQIARYQQDIKAQRNSLTTWLKTEKQGEAIVAVIYTRGFKDSAHELESQADQASAPLMARHMGTYVQSFTKVIDNVLTEDFIRTIEEGTAEWNREEPLADRAQIKRPAAPPICASNAMSSILSRRRKPDKGASKGACRPQETGQRHHLQGGPGWVSSPATDTRQGQCEPESCGNNDSGDHPGKPPGR
jgi:hypothetical protein